MDISENSTDGNVAPEREPIETNKFWANRSGEAIVTRIMFFRGRPFLDCRRYFTDKQGKLAPTKKGFTILLRKMPELMKALAKTEAEARSLGLITEGDE